MRWRPSQSRALKFNFRPCCVVAILLLASGLCAENLLPNPSFDAGVQPSGWRLAGGKGQWVAASDQGRGALMVEGNGDDASRWETERMRLQTGTLLALRFSARRDPAVAYTTPLTISGVPSSLYSGRLPRLSVLKRQASSSLPKLDALIWSSGRYLLFARSAPYVGHSPALAPCWPQASKRRREPSR